MDNQNPNAERSNDSGTGYLIVRATTARSAVPVPGATINIIKANGETSHIIYSLKTDRNGMAEKISLAAPLKQVSISDDVIRPYALYNIEVYADGYAPQSYLDVPVYDGITSYQTADLIPLPSSSQNNHFLKPEIFKP
jgi:hypothetical protein